MSELAVLICDYVGPPTLKCFGETLSDFGSVIERVAGLYSPN